MVGVAASDACAQFNNILDPGEDLELERMIAFCTHIPDNPTTVQPRCLPVHHVPEFIGNDINPQNNVPQYNCPPPVTAHDYQPLPYPTPWVQDPGQTVACYASSDNPFGAARAQHCTYTNNLTVAPNQTIFLDAGEPDATYARARDDADSSAAVHQSTLYVNPYMLQPIASDQDSAHLQPLTDSHTSFISCPDPLRDGSTPYVPGHVAGRKRHLQHLTDALTAVVEQSMFECDACGKDCKTRAALSHHKITHDKGKARRHKCNNCDAGFRYPKDLKRHHGAKHGEVRYSCADCHKTYKRKDHLSRHLLCQGHSAMSEGSSLPSTSTPTAYQHGLSSQNSLDSHQGGHAQLDYNSEDQTSSSFGQHVTSSSPINTRGWHPHTTHLEVPSSSLGFVVNGSLDGSFTASEVDSFSNESFAFE